MKRDAQTGNAVPRAGFTFQLLNGDREPISQTSWHPAHTVMNTFATDETGTVTLPESLNPGTYYIRETSAKEPYLVDEDLEITIPADMNLTPVAVASFYDDAATGSIEIVKNDAVGGRALAGAVFDIRAVGDIVRPDGSIAALDGETVATITTDERGFACANHLSLGCGTATYEVIEVQAPEGYLLDQSVHTVELSYAGQETPVIDAHLDVSNDYTKIDISKVDLTGKQEVDGARLSLHGADGTEIDAWTSSDKPHRIEHLFPGTYTLREVMPPRTYDLAEDMTFEIKATGEVQTVAMKDAPIEIEAKSTSGKRSPALSVRVSSPTAMAKTEPWHNPMRTAPSLIRSMLKMSRIPGLMNSPSLTISNAPRKHCQTHRHRNPVATGDIDGLCNVWYRTSPVGSIDTGEQTNATLSDGHDNPGSKRTRSKSS